MALRKKLELMFPLEGVVPDGSQYLQSRCECPQRDFESNLIVSCRSAAVGNSLDASLFGKIRELSRLQATLSTHAKRIQIAPPDIPHDQEPNHFVKKRLASLDQYVIDGTQGQGAFTQSVCGFRIQPTGIDGGCNDLPLIGFFEPGDTK